MRKPLGEAAGGAGPQEAAVAPALVGRAPTGSRQTRLAFADPLKALAGG